MNQLTLMKNHYRITIIFFLTILSGFFEADILNAQINFDHYAPLKCSGKIPEEFLTTSVERSKQLIAEEEASGKHPITDAGEKQFFLNSTFLVNDLFRSGKILFGDTVTTYVNKVADRILESDPELHHKLHFYCLRTSEANAFSTLTGDVFVTLGLLAQLENEAQLAFILSHEIGHFEMKHALREFEQNRNVNVTDEGGEDEDESKMDERIKNASNFSKSMEMEADSVGLIRMQNAGYDCEESIGALFVLQFSELPFDEVAFTFDFLQAGEMKFPKSLALDSVKPIDLDGDMENDDYSSHPNIAKRNQHIETLMGDQSCTAKKFIGTENEFVCARKISRYETIRMELGESDYVPAFYNSYVLTKTDSASFYLRSCMAKSLYSLSMYKNHGGFNDVTKSYTKMEGMQQQCYYFFAMLTKPQLNMIALRYTYDVLLSDTTSNSMKTMCSDLAVEAVAIHEIHMESLRSSTKTYHELMNPDTLASSANSGSVKDSSIALSKYDKLRIQKKMQEKSELSDMKNSEASKFHLLAFSDIINSPELNRLFESAEKNSVNYTGEVVSGHATTSLDDAELNPQDTRLGMDSIVFIGPYYFSSDDKVGFDALSSSMGLTVFSQQITSCASAAKVTYQTIFPDKFTADDVEKYNDLSALIEWQDECVGQNSVALLPCGTDLVEPLQIKYKSKHFLFLAINTLKEKRSKKNLTVVIIMTSVVVGLGSLTLVGAAPILLALAVPIVALSALKACSPRFSSTYRALLVNSESGTIPLNENDHYNKSPSPDCMKLWLKTSFGQIKNKPYKHKT